MSERLLVLVRHGQSDWNLKNLFTGWKDPGLTEQGIGEAKAAGQRLKALGLSFDTGFTSDLTRAQNTMKLILAELGQTRSARRPGIRRSTSAITATFRASTRTRRARNGARTRSMSGAGPMTCPRPAAKA